MKTVPGVIQGNIDGKVVAAAFFIGKTGDGKGLRSAVIVFQLDTAADMQISANITAVLSVYGSFIHFFRISAFCNPGRPDRTLCLLHIGERKGVILRFTPCSCLYSHGVGNPRVCGKFSALREGQIVVGYLLHFRCLLPVGSFVVQGKEGQTGDQTDRQAYGQYGQNGAGFVSAQVSGSQLYENFSVVVCR